MKIIQEHSLNYDDVLILPQISTINSRKDVILERTFQFYHSPRTWTGIPIVCSNMGFVGHDVCQVMAQNKMITAIPKFLVINKMADIVRLCGIDYAWITLGIQEDDLNRLDKILENFKSQGIETPNFVLDCPNGYITRFPEFCKKVREKTPESIICAGNVCTPDMAKILILNGVDIVKIGIGPGSMCTTRIKTGVGLGQLTANLWCSEVHGVKYCDKRLGLIMSDGGCNVPGDIAKAFGSGSDFVMIGGMFAGCEESIGEWTFEQNIIYKYYGDKSFSNIYPYNTEGTIISYMSGITYKNTLIPHKNNLTESNGKKLDFISYGMSSKFAQDKHGGGYKSYRASEGRVVKIPNKGPLQGILDDITGSLRSYLSYVGANGLKDAPKCTKFVVVNNTHNRFFENNTIGE